MLYVYDNAICDDLKQSFNTDEVNNPIVKVIAPDGMLDVVSQIKEGYMTYPIVGLSRSDSIEIDTDRANFTRRKRGVSTVLDKETNDLYYEEVLPIKLSYDITVLTTNTADMDEMLRELMFKYSNMYFLTTKIPYESKRTIRFGVILDENSTIERSSGTYEYISSGTLYQSRLHVICEGCVMVNYTPVKLKRFVRGGIDAETLEDVNSNLV